MGSERHISSFEELTACMDELHDYPFTLSQATLDASEKVWTGVFLRPMLEAEDRITRNGSFLAGKIECPVANASVTIRGVSGIKVLDDQGIDTYSFNGVERIVNGFRLEFNEALALEFEVERFDATYLETELRDTTAIFKNFLIVESGPENHHKK